MMPNDIALWERFLTQHKDLFDRIDYDLHVGTGYGYSEDDPEWRINLASALTQFRIDAVGWSGSQPTIIEVKPYAGLSALGQVLGYQFFFHFANPEFPTPNLAVVTDGTTGDIRGLYDFYKVTLYEMGSP